MINGNAAQSIVIVGSRTMCSYNVFSTLTIAFKIQTTIRPYFRYKYKWKSAQRRRKHCALAVVRRTHKQTNTQTDRGDYNTLRSLARSLNMTLHCICNTKYKTHLCILNTFSNTCIWTNYAILLLIRNTIRIQEPLIKFLARRDRDPGQYCQSRNPWIENA